MSGNKKWGQPGCPHFVFRARITWRVLEQAQQQAQQQAP